MYGEINRENFGCITIKRFRFFFCKLHKDLLIAKNKMITPFYIFCVCQIVVLVGSLLFIGALFLFVRDFESIVKVFLIYTLVVMVITAVAQGAVILFSRHKDNIKFKGE